MMDELTDEVEAARARLLARGLLATQPRGAARDEFARFDDGGDSHWEDDERDDWDVEHGTDEVAWGCPTCRAVFLWPVESTRMPCTACQRTWRWAICGECDAFALTIERQESWRCAGCGHVTRSWWRTPMARRDAMAIVARRKHEVVQEERAAVRAGMRRRRWKLVTLAVVAALAATGIVLGFRLAEPSAATGTAVTCAHFGRVRSALASGTLNAAQLDREFDELQREAQSAAPDVARAFVDLRASGAPGSPTFLFARTAAADACAAAGH